MPKFHYCVVDGEGFRYGQITTCESQDLDEVIQKRLKLFVEQTNQKRRQSGLAPEIDIELCTIDEVCEMD
jgi:hypothetical protein